MLKWNSPHTVEITIDGQLYRIEGEGINDPERGWYWWVCPQDVHICTGSTSKLISNDQQRIAILETLYAELRRRGIAFEE